MHKSIRPWHPLDRPALLTTTACSALALQPCLRITLAGKAMKDIVWWMFAGKKSWEIIYFMHFFRAILKNNWSEVVDLILKPRPGGKGRIFLYLWCKNGVKKLMPLFYCHLQQRKNSWSAAEKSGQELRTQRQLWKNCPTSAVWRGSCCEASQCMARRT